ncbi:hypothetical protein ACOXXX_14530 [Thalassococcus sp. BH17M4-6]|uniref:hypothetical protein n=1 Tax=Thalassococcus sp. BH17M4-6 TaxID=3413148 RepID=UPI003BE9DCAE
MQAITLSLPEPTLQAAKALADARDITLGQLLRQALSDELGKAQRTAKTPNRADEQLIGPLRALLAADFGQARSWDELQSRLHGKGFALREAGGGLALHSHPEGLRLCKASELGHAYASLMRRFGTPFPGHAHRHLADRLLGRPQQKGPPQGDPNDDFDVIERDQPFLSTR